MNILPLAAFSLTLLAASLPLVSPAQAGTAIQRCASADGTTVYTDTPCALLGASPRPLPGDVLTRIARDAAALPAPRFGERPVPAVVAVARRAPTAGCARTPTQLSMDLQGSLALADVNRLAESYHWVGMSHTQSQPIMQRLERLARHPLIRAQFYDARIGPGGMQLAGGGSTPAGVLQLHFGGTSPQVVDFEVEPYAGCYFVRF